MTEKLRYRADTQSPWDIEPGEFCYRRAEHGAIKWLHFWPHGSSCCLSAAIRPQKNGVGASWDLTGPEDRPTLRPSVNAKGIWHGFLTDGVAQSC